MWNLEWSNACGALVKEQLADWCKAGLTELNTVLLHWNWSRLRRKYWSKIPTDINVLSCGRNSIEHFGYLGRHLTPRYIRKNPHCMYARVLHAMVQFVLKIKRNIPYHRDFPNTRNGASLQFPPTIMASIETECQSVDSLLAVARNRNNFPSVFCYNYYFFQSSKTLQKALINCRDSRQFEWGVRSTPSMFRYAARKILC